MGIVKERSIWIGVDVGTTGVRAIAYEASGVNLAASEAFYPLRTPHPDWAEERPAEILAATEQVVREVADALRYQGRTPSGIALSTVMHSLIPLDAEKQPLTDMQTWADSHTPSQGQAAGGGQPQRGHRAHAEGRGAGALPLVLRAHGLPHARLLSAREDPLAEAESARTLRAREVSRLDQGSSLPCLYGRVPP